MHCPYYGACRDEMQEEEGRILLIVMRRTFPFEPIEPAEPFPVVIKGRHAPWANPEPFLYVIIRTILCHTVFRCIYVPQLHSIGVSRVFIADCLSS